MYSSLRNTTNYLLLSILPVVLCIGISSSVRSAPVDIVRTTPGIICTDSIDTRGDINYNYLSYEIADCDLYRAFFLKGASVFTVAPAKQMLASDVNADGDTLTVSDLAYEVLVITGLIYPIPKSNATDPADQVRLYVAHDTLYMESPRTIGGLFLIFNANLQPVLLQVKAGLDYKFDGTQTRALILGDAPYTVAQLHPGAVLTCPNLIPPVEAQASDTVGRNMQVVIESPTDVVTGPYSAIPSTYSLANNYPNPFNPTTTISFSLPRTTSYTLSIYDLSGHEVSSLSGVAGPGVVRKEWDGSGFASGVYLYKLTAGTFTDTKKMLLVK